MMISFAGGRPGAQPLVTRVQPQGGLPIAVMYVGLNHMYEARLHGQGQQER